MSRRLVIVLALGSPMFGCPANDTNAGDGETGEDVGVPIPLDPFDGEGSNPPGSPDISLDWPQPLTLGNGLVHDSRYDLQAGEYSKTFTAAQLVAGVDWANSFVSSHALKLRSGFRPTQVDAEVSMVANLDDTLELTITDRSVYVSDDDANYKTKIKTYVFGNAMQEQSLDGSGVSKSGEPRPTSIDTFALPAGRVGVTIAFVYDNNPTPWKVVIGQSQPVFETTIADLSGQGYRPISIASRRRNGVSEYAAIFVKDAVAPDDWQVMLGHDAVELAAAVSTAWSDGYYPFAGTYEQGSQGQPTFNVLWIARSPGLKLELRYNMDEIQFEGEDRDWRQRGYHLEGACAYKDAGVQRYAAIWVRHEPYLRWLDGVAVDPMDPSYITRHLPFHQQALSAITLAGAASEGEFFRPSATLHIFEGTDLVVNRAYTYAGAIYPETPLNAPMAIASASKSITAAAVVRELWQKGIPLNAPFAGAAGINNVAAMAAVPRIVDVLRNLGGFNTSARSFADHSIIDASPYGDYPITGKMMYDYAVLDGHLDEYEKDLSKHPASYWNLTTYLKAQDAMNPVFVYSNPGFAMLGELVRVLSGEVYADYVRTHLLAPLLLEQAIYPDPGHRNAVREPTQAGLRSYLINTAHPYNPVDCEADVDCKYLACEFNDPNPNCVVPTCGLEGKCGGCSSNAKSCRSGWACLGDECVNLILPRMRSEPVPAPSNGDNSPTWSPNAGPPDSSAPATAAQYRYAGLVYMGGAPLAAGGWHGDGASLGLLMRVLAQTDYLMPGSVAAQLWSPVWLSTNQDRAPNWRYGLGWYARGNWIAMAGGTDGAMSLVLHNRAYDITVVFLSNVQGNAFGEIMNPLLVTGNGNLSPVGFPCPGNCAPSPAPQSILGGPFPCIDDVGTQKNECVAGLEAY